MEFIIALVFLLYATYTDIKTMEVPNWWSYSFIGVVAIFQLRNSYIANSFDPFLNGLYGFIIFFAIGYILYEINYWGGADVYALGGLAGLYGLPTSIYHPFFGFLFYFLIIGASFGILYSIYLGLKHKVKLSLDWYVVIPIALYFVDFLLFLIGLLSYILYLLIPFLKNIEKHMFKKIPISKLTAEDWLVKDMKVGKSTIKKTDKLTKKKVSLLKSHYKVILVKSGLPFLPVFLAALLLNVIRPF